MVGDGDALGIWQLNEGDLVIINGHESEIRSVSDNGDTFKVSWFNHETNEVLTEELVWDLEVETWGYSDA